MNVCAGALRLRISAPCMPARTEKQIRATADKNLFPLLHAFFRRSKNPPREMRPVGRFAITSELPVRRTAVILLQSGDHQDHRYSVSARLTGGPCYPTAGVWGCNLYPPNTRLLIQILFMYTTTRAE